MSSNDWTPRLGRIATASRSRGARRSAIWLVARGDPFASGMGGELRVEIQFEGKPLAGATVHLYTDAASADLTTHAADQAGVVRVPLARGGLHVLSVSHDVASRHPELATGDVYAGTLVFTRP